MIRQMVVKYYDRADQEFIMGLIQTIGIALSLFAVFKVADYFVAAPAHDHRHFGLMWYYPILSWSMQILAFVGIGLVVFFARLWRGTIKANCGLDYEEIQELTRTLQCRDTQLKKERSRFKQVVDFQMEFVSKHLPDGELTFVNKALYELMGHDTWEALTGTNVYEYLEEGDAVRLRALHKRLTPNNPRFIDTQRIRIADGKLRWVEWQNCGIFDKNGVLVKVLGVGRDVTDRHIVAAKLKESESRFRNLFNHMIAGFAVHIIDCRLDPDTGREIPCDYHFVDVNPAFEKMFGFTREEVVGRTVLEIMPNTEPDLISRFGRVAETGKPDHFTCRFIDIRKWFQVTAFSNQPGQFAATFLDVTDQNDRRGKRERKTD